MRMKRRADERFKMRRNKVRDETRRDKMRRG